MAPMRPSRKETEVKLRYESASAASDALLSQGAVLTGEREFEDNIVFDTANMRLRQEGMLLRLRRRGDRTILTLKAPVEGEHRHKVREERETDVGDFDEMRAIFSYLGFTPVYRYQKHRTRFRAGELEACLDETPIGCFVELEGDPGGIDAFAERLGRGVEDYVVATYRELQESVDPRGEQAGDMLVTADEERRPGP